MSLGLSQRIMVSYCLGAGRALVTVRLPEGALMKLANEHNGDADMLRYRE